ncbi:Ribosomal protein L11 methyltransferase (L11 Mtase), partial [Durusdinium trenchii]
EVLDKDLDFYTREGDWRSSTIAWTPLIPEEVDVVLANIVVGPLCRSAKMVGQLLRPDGQVLLAGMKEFQVKQVEEAFEDFDLQVKDIMDGWTFIAGTKT